MCLILFAYKCHPRFPLILAGNRDEFFDRPTAPAEFWEDAPQILAGRDLRCRGTWLGVTREGRIAVLANHRDYRLVRENARSRGMLVSDLLLGDPRGERQLEKLRRTSQLYSGYSVIFGTARELFYFTNSGHDVSPEIVPGIHGQSNSVLDSPWPKVVKAMESLKQILQSARDPEPEDLLTMLTDTSIAEDRLLPDTGVELETERLLSAIFVKGMKYGTRSSTVVLMDRENVVTFIERSYNGGPEAFSTVRYEFPATE